MSINGRHLSTEGIGHPNGVLHSIVELDRGIPGYFLQGWDGQTDEFFAWSAPKIEIGDRITVNVIETEQIHPPPLRSSTGCRKEEAPDGARYVSLRKKYEEAAARPEEHHPSDLAERIGPAFGMSFGFDCERQSNGAEEDHRKSRERGAGDD